MAGRGYDDGDGSVPAERQALGETAEVPDRSHGEPWRQMALVSNSALLCLFTAEEAEGRRTAGVLKPWREVSAQPGEGSRKGLSAQRRGERASPRALTLLCAREGRHVLVTSQLLF